MAKSNRKLRKRVPRSKPNLLHNDMKLLLEAQKAQETKFVPEVPDVPRIRFKADQLVNVELSYSVQVSLSTTTPTFGALAFALNAASNYNSYVGAFDQYRVIQVNVKLLNSPLAAGMSSYIYTAIDYDDSNAPSSPSTLLSYNTLMITPLGVPCERTLTPRIAVAAYGGSTFNSYANQSSKMFIDSASPAVQYYGLKYYAPTQTVANTTFFFVTLMVQFKSQRST